MNGLQRRCKRIGLGAAVTVVALWSLETPPTLAGRSPMPWRFAVARAAADTLIVRITNAANHAIVIFDPFRLEISIRGQEDVDAGGTFQTHEPRCNSNSHWGKILVPRRGSIRLLRSLTQGGPLTAKGGAHIILHVGLETTDRVDVEAAG